MALPKIMAPTYEFVTKSSGKTIKHTAGLMKHEKIFAVALESCTGEPPEKAAEIINCVVDLVLSDCLISHKIEELSITEMEELWLNIRAVSVSPDITVKYKAAKSCIDAGHFTENFTKINILEYVIESTSGKTIQQVAEEHNMVDKGDKWVYSMTPEIGLVLKIPIGMKTAGGDKIKAVIHSIYHNDEVFEEFTEEELNEFIGQLPSGLMEPVDEFINAIPTVVMPVTIKCKQCEKTRNTKIKGLYDFFV